MALSILTPTVFNPPYGIDESNQRMWLRGKFAFGASPGTYATGGLLPGAINTNGWADGSLLDASGQAVLIPKFTTPPVFVITNIALTSNVVTVTAVHSLVALQFVTLNGISAATAQFLNGVTLQVASVSTTVSFTANYTHANVTSVASTGQVVQVIGPDDLEIHSVAGSGFIYSYNKANATVQIFTGAAAQSPLTELSAGAVPAGVSGDTIHFVASWAKQ